jgi:exonuclease SbcD
MPNGTLRLIQASDFHLECPLHGVAEVPDHLRGLLLDAPFTAAEQVFETAVTERVDLVALAGGIVDPRRADPRAVVFLERQFRRLAEHEIQVYWAGGSTDAAGHWRKPGALAENVHVFANDTVEEQVHHRGGEPVARIVGFSRGRGGKLRIKVQRRQHDGLPIIGIGNGSAAVRPLTDLGANFVALGGKHAGHERASDACLVHYSGTPQGRTPQEPGPHGCSLVTIDATGRASVAPVVTDVARWVDVHIDIDTAADRGVIEAQIDRAIADQIAAARGIDLLVSWRLCGQRGPILRELCHGNLAATLLTSLRGRYGHASPAAWSVSLMAELPAPPAVDDCDPETILGGFLKAADLSQADRSDSLDLGRFLPERLAAEPKIAAAVRPRGAKRRRLVAEAARLGADLLGG